MPTTDRLDPMNADAAAPTDAAQVQATPVHARSARRMARMAIERWANGAACAGPEATAAAPLSAQAHWYATAHHDFQQWLANGGFSQPAPANPNPAWFDITALGDKPCMN